ncbi:hypothetical protein [Methylobacterium soli]|uniref:Uncharacterized protein n=1 Tax=Methylobacterium soli TaxID=553447 RepID=A0A6L3T512_9HYPH|nr:hypothetical protein [Methylobacterium soli]KAB1080347.1 hypothetical protein F6X53_06510 [Methylobacterium soli]GJE41090.1 hypothetical protein AEGHOMDF_0250 [Methylobacterium soli]
MPPTLSRHATRRSLVALTATGLILGTAASVHAQDAGGLGGLFQQLFGGARPAQQAAPQPAEVQMPSPERYYGRRHDRRAEGARLRPKIRYAALPKPEPLKVTITDRQTPLDMKAGPAAALLRDETLRPGDIVVLKDGARVFTGNPDKRHAMHEFQAVEQSSRVDRKTRRLLAAMIAPVGAMPADQARKALARLHKATPEAAPPAQQQAEATAMRVIYPWNTNP